MVMYRSRLRSDLSKITLEYVSSISDDLQILNYDIIGSQAHVIMLYEQKIITKSEAGKILKALEGLKERELEDVCDAEDIHELVESLVIKKTGIAIGGKMHTARSRNDQVALDMRMKIRDDINIINSCLLDTAEAMVSIAQKHRKTIMPLYTHMQQAQVGTLSHYLLAHADALLRDFERFYGSYDRVNQSPLGAGPVGGTSIPIDRESTSRMLGFDGLVENSIDATSTRDFVAEYLGNVSIAMTNLSRLAEDFVIWSTAEFSFIELSDEFTSPSSVMPQKKNPDILELTRGKTADVIGNLMGVLCTVKGLATGYGRDLQQIKSPVWSTSKTMISALLVVKPMLLTMSVNETRMKRAADSGYLVALDIAEALVQKNIPFRTAHKISGRIVQVAHQEKKQISKITPKEISSCLGNAEIGVQAIQDIIAASTVNSSLRKRVSKGSSGFSEQKRMIAQRVRKINMCRTRVSKRDDGVYLAMEGLASKVTKLTK